MPKMSFFSRFFGRYQGWSSYSTESEDDKTLARYDFVITFGKRYQEEFRDEYDERLIGIVDEMRESISTDFERFVRELLGNEILVRIDKLESGSIVGTITLVLASALSVYTFISQYHDFLESLELIRNQLYSRITRVLGRGNNLWDTTISIVITKIPYQTQSQPVLQPEPTPIYSTGFFWYLFVSNILLIIALGFLIYKAVVSVYFAP